MSEPNYPNAIWLPLDPPNTPEDKAHSVPGTLAQRCELVLHISEGSTASGAMQSARESVHPERKSFHFIVDRDAAATVYQCVSISDTAWHASAVNSHSIGIEHAAMSLEGARLYNEQYAQQIIAGKQKPFIYLPATDAQYAASAKLIVWLCGQMNMPIDRIRIRTHNEASPKDEHVQCCTGALDPDRLVQQAQAVAAASMS